MHQLTNATVFLGHAAIEELNVQMGDGLIRMQEVFEDGVDNITSSETNSSEVISHSIQQLHSLIPIILTNITSKVGSLFSGQQVVSF